MTLPPPAPPRLRGLDGFRGVAVLLVILFHGQRVFSETVVIPAVNAGWIGVDLFFVLSGFLITGILRRTRADPRYWRNFVIRRVLRILPAYTLLLALVLGPRLLAGMPSTVPWWTYVAFVSNFWIGLDQAHDVALDFTWSLSVEEQFYLVWPLVVAVLGRRGLVALCLAIVMASPLLRLALHDAATEVTYMWTPCRLDSLAAGALAAVWREATPAPRRGSATWIALAGLVPVAIVLAVHGDLRTSLPFVVFGYTAVAIGTAGLLVALTDGRLPRVVRALEWRPLAHLGTVSYGAYLFHGAFAAALSSLALPWGVGTAVLVGVTWAFATLLWRTLEEPLLRWKDRIAAYATPPRA